jgi:hypothetical protein
MPLEREDERDVDRAPGGDRVLDRPDPGLGRGDLHVEIPLVDELVQPFRLLEGLVALVGEIRVDLDGDEAVDTVGAVPGRAHEIAGVLDVLGREREEDLLDVVVALELRAELVVVPLSGGERLLEDGRVRGDADHCILVHESGEMAGLEHLSRKRIDPDADAVLRKLMQAATRHSPTLPPRR